jgi:mannose-6-phosphate isomerase-like protein (cupin superfamily)
MPSGKVFVINLNHNAKYQKLLGGRPQTCGMHSNRVYLRPGQTCGQHSTNHHEEMLVFLSGQGQLLIGEKDRFQVGEGRASYIPPHTVHEVKNTGSEPLIYIYCAAPASGGLDE